MFDNNKTLINFVQNVILPFCHQRPVSIKKFTRNFARGVKLINGTYHQLTVDINNI